MNTQEFNRLIGGSLPMMPETIEMPDGFELVVLQVGIEPQNPERILRTIELRPFGIIVYLYAPEGANMDDLEF